MEDKLALICGYSIDKVVKIIDDYKQGNLLRTKGTVKLRKGDYVLYKHSWLKEHLDMEYKMLGGKAIPISWLEEKAEQYQKAYEAEIEQNGYDASRYYLYMYNAINTLIDEWETENV